MHGVTSPTHQSTHLPVWKRQTSNTHCAHRLFICGRFLRLPSDRHKSGPVTSCPKRRNGGWRQASARRHTHSPLSPRFSHFPTPHRYFLITQLSVQTGRTRRYIVTHNSYRSLPTEPPHASAYTSNAIHEISRLWTLTPPDEMNVPFKIGKWNALGTTSPATAFR
jgi:hypothetical protein